MFKKNAGQEKTGGEALPRILDFGLDHGHYPQVIKYMGKVYDPHGGETSMGSCIYRVMNYSDTEQSAYHIEVDRSGHVLAQWKWDERWPRKDIV